LKNGFNKKNQKNEGQIKKNKTKKIIEKWNWKQKKLQ
jgi:hypothetical protein